MNIDIRELVDPDYRKLMQRDRSRPKINNILDYIINANRKDDERMIEKTTSQIISMIMAGYLINGCEGCPFYGIEEYEIDQVCDSVPINCSWVSLWKYFEAEEQKKIVYKGGFNNAGLEKVEG